MKGTYWQQALNMLNGTELYDRPGHVKVSIEKARELVAGRLPRLGSERRVTFGPFTGYVTRMWKAGEWHWSVFSIRLTADDRSVEGR